MTGTGSDPNPPACDDPGGRFGGTLVIDVLDRRTMAQEEIDEIVVKIPADFPPAG